MSTRTYALDVPESKSEALAELALNLRWTWNHSADGLWGRLDPELWELTQNPCVILQTISAEKLKAAWSDTAFQKRVEDLLREKREEQTSATWFQKAHPDSKLASIAYFSMEYMLSEALPIYSGGLGNVAGDQLKAASDLGVPVVGLGLLYQQGYFRQEIDASGAQLELYPFNDPGQLPIAPLRQTNGEWLRLPLSLPGLQLWVRAWQVDVGRLKLYLLDTNDPANPPAYRGITSELYGGGPELRIKQELILGVGGWRLLRAIGLQPEVCHLNEGHAAFAVLERARSYKLDTGQPFDVAMAVTRAGNLFTTHTPVEAGFDRFAPELAKRYLTRYAEQLLGIPVHDLLAMGRQNPDDDSEPFNMAYLAMRGSGAINGVSRLHGEVSRRIFQPLFPRWPQRDVPVRHVTNGVHVPTWESTGARQLWAKTCGVERWLGEMENMEAAVGALRDEQLWQLRADTTRQLIAYTRMRWARQLAVQGAPPEQVVEAQSIFDSDVLTMGFARRFAPYKRPNLLLLDAERLIRILTHPQRPVQLILAGKAHPQDREGQQMIRRWNEFIRRAGVRSHVVFLSDYDMLLTQRLVQGVDLWINTPRRPWEASGTSGMKVLVNGGLNLSELDGWWAEAYAPEVGWALGDGKEHDADPAWDRAEAARLYDLLEQQVVPAFYNRDARGIPTAWVAMMRQSMARLTGMFSANRTVRAYTDQHYVPACAAYRSRSEANGRFGVDFVKWRNSLAERWPHVRFGTLQATTIGGSHHFEVQVHLDELDPDAVQVELYAEPGTDGRPVREPMARVSALAGAVGGFLYGASVPATRPTGDYTPRLIPSHPGALVPLEASQIMWQR